MCPVSGARVGFDMGSNHFFPQHVLATINLTDGEAVVGGSKACTGCQVGFPLCSVAVINLSEVEVGLKLLE